MKAELFLKGASSTLDQGMFPIFGFVYLSVAVFAQFVWGGMKAAKILLLVDELQFSENEAVIIMHLQASLMDLAMCIGNTIANLHCGSYITCLAQEVLKALFTCPMCTLATMGFMELEDRRKLYLYGQVMGVITSFGNSCISTFLADQFNTINYLKFNRIQLMITLSCSALGIFTVPHLIQYYQCFWTKTCYSFVWLCEWALCVITVLLFVTFYKSLSRGKPKYSSTYSMLMLLQDALSKRRKERKLGRVPDKALFEYSEMYNAGFRKDAQKMWSMWTFYFPMAGYWALHSQQSTTWILQAKRMNGDLFGWSTILPNELWGVIPLTGLAFRMIILTFMEDPKYPLRLTVFSQMIMTVAFLLAAGLEKYITSLEDYQVHIVWALPQLLLVSISDIIIISSYRKFIIREVPARFRGVTQTLFVLSRSFGNAIVVLVNVLDMQTGFPNRFGQFIMYSIILNLFLIIFTVLNSKFERLLQDEGSSGHAGPSTAHR